MCVSARLYHCCRCHAQVVVCSRCDRGQRYCPDGCRHLARSDSLKRSSKKYQSSRRGRLNNAGRQQQFRQRLRQKVTHQGSTTKPRCDLLDALLTTTKKVLTAVEPAPILHCHFCHCACDAFLRHRFLHSQVNPSTFTFRRSDDYR